MEIDWIATKGLDIQDFTLSHHSHMHYGLMCRQSILPCYITAVGVATSITMLK